MRKYIGKVGVFPMRRYEKLIGENIFQECEQDGMRNVIEKHMRNGVIFKGTRGVTVSEEAEIGSGTVIEEYVIIGGNSVIGGGSFISSFSRIENSEIGDGTKIVSSNISDSSIGSSATVGPYAHIHTSSKIGDETRIGNFVEIKNSVLGNGSKAAHLAYIGDTDIGEKCNIGCGVIFVNYNGKEKRRSKVGNGAFIGSNSNVIAPVVVEDGAYLAAGSTLTVDLPKGSLCIARSRETVKENGNKYYDKGYTK